MGQSACRPVGLSGGKQGMVRVTSALVPFQRSLPSSLSWLLRGISFCRPPRHREPYEQGGRHTVSLRGPRSTGPARFRNATTPDHEGKQRKLSPRVPASTPVILSPYATQRRRSCDTISEMRSGLHACFLGTSRFAASHKSSDQVHYQVKSSEACLQSAAEVVTTYLQTRLRCCQKAIYTVERNCWTQGSNLCSFMLGPKYEPVVKFFTFFGFSFLAHSLMFASSFQFERSIAKAITGRVLRIRYTVSRLLSASEKEEQEKQQEPKSKGSATNQPEISEGDMKIVESFRAHQKGALRPSMAEEARTLIENSSMFGVLSANSDAMPGYPTGSVVGFDMDVEGKPFFVFSTLAAHIKDVLKDSRTSLTVMAADFKGASEGRATITGDIVKVTDEAKRAELREKYLSRHKDAYWVDFGDFSFFHMQSIQNVRYVGGFAMIGNVTSDQFLAAKPDPLAAFAVPVIKHMNEDHEDALISMLKHYCGIPVSEAKLIGIDRLGMTIQAKIEIPAAGDGYSKVRLPFIRETTERKKLKDVIIEMTTASAASSK